MADVLIWILVGIAGLVLVAAVAYILGFIISMLVSAFTGPYEAIKHHNHPVAG